MANLAAFYETRETFRSFFHYIEPLSFDDWVKLSDDRKIAVLYLQYFNEIILAWDKANTFDFVEGEEGVTCILQYLQKHVCDRYIKGHNKKKVSKEYFNQHPEECEERRIIESDPKKFTPAYIYRMAYNCLYCICHDLKSVKDRWSFETSEIVIHDGEELSLFDLVADRNGSVEDVIHDLDLQREFWKVIEDEGAEAEKLMRFLMSGNSSDLKKLNSKNPQNQKDPLRDVEVKPEAIDSILERLRNRFMNLSSSSACGSYISAMLASASH